jgi:uncharacterized membrane protein
VAPSLLAQEQRVGDGLILANLRERSDTRIPTVLLAQAGNLESDYPMQDEMISHGPRLDEPSADLLPAARSQDPWEYRTNSFLAIVYSETSRAGKVLKALKQMRSPKLIDLESAVYVTRDGRGRTQLREPGFRRKKNTIGDSITGLVAGSILLAPIGGVTLAEATDTVKHKLANLHVDRSFTEAVRTELQPDSSAIFILIQKASPSEVIPRITPYGGTVLETFLSEVDKTRLEEAIRAASVH